MRARNDLDRLSAAAPEWLARTEPVADPDEEDRILARILASPRPTAHPSRRRATLVLAGVAVLAAAATVAVLEFGHGNQPTPRASGGHHVPLAGARIELAGYHFKTPAGFKSSDASCEGATPTPPGSPETPVHAMQSAASADGGCIEVFWLIAGSPTAPTPSPAGQPVDVGPFQGYYDAQGDSGATLYVELPKASTGGAAPVLLALYAQGLTEDQLVAVAASGLPSSSP